MAGFLNLDEPSGAGGVVFDSVALGSLSGGAVFSKCMPRLSHSFKLYSVPDQGTSVMDVTDPQNISLCFTNRLSSSATVWPPKLAPLTPKEYFHAYHLDPSPVGKTFKKELFRVISLNGLD